MGLHGRRIGVRAPARAAAEPGRPDEIEGERTTGPRRQGRLCRCVRGAGRRDVYDTILARPHGDGRAHLRRLRGRRPPRRHRRRRPRAGAHARDRPLPLLQPDEVEVPDEAVPPTKQILVAGVGNAWLARRRLRRRRRRARLPSGAFPTGSRCMDFGTGGLDLAYEVMRGYDALVLVDVSRQGGEPGTLYVIEPDPSRDRGDRGRRGDQPARDGPEDRAALRQDGRRLARARSWWSPASRRRSRRWGWSSRERSRRRSTRAAESCCEQIAELQYRRRLRGELSHARALDLAGDLDTALRHAEGGR